VVANSQALQSAHGDISTDTLVMLRRFGLSISGPSAFGTYASVKVPP